MLDINLIRENPDLVKSNQVRAKAEASIVDEVLKIDVKWRKKKQEVDSLRSKRNQISQRINELMKLKKQSEAKSLIKEAKSIPDEIKAIETQADKLQEKRDALLKEMPNIISKETPIGESDKDNKEIRKVGKIRKFNFPIKNHVELCEELDIVDFDQSAKVSGNGFYYLKNELAILNQALIRLTIDFMKKKKYDYIETPLMIRKDILSTSEGSDVFSQSIYDIKEEDLALIGTAEHSLMAMHKEAVFRKEDLPKKYFSYSMCFRKEIGSHGINEKGLWRTHQFNKVEQFIFCHPKDSAKLYEELLKNSEEIMKALELPYRVIEICIGDLPRWKHRSHDIEVWRPTTESYGEVGSLTNVTDYQARDHDIKFLDENNKRQVVHTLNNTAMATSRIMVAIIENFQNKDGSIDIPKALQKYTGFKKIEATK